MKYRIAVVNMTGGKAERDKLDFAGDAAGRALILANDSLYKYGGVDALLCVGMSNYQMERAVDSHMTARGYVKIIHPDYATQKDKYRFTCVTAAYVKRELKAKQVCYDKTNLETIYRYAAFALDDETEIRVLHMPVADASGKRYEKQLARKKAMMLWEQELEKDAEASHKKVISCGDFNCEAGNMECHEIYDELPFEKLLDEPTWEDKKLDNVLVSSALSGKVKAFTGDYRLGKTSDHKTVIIEVEE